MTRRQLVTIDVTFTNDYRLLKTNQVMRMLLDMNQEIKNVSIQIVNKKKDTK